MTAQLRGRPDTSNSTYETQWVASVAVAREEEMNTQLLLIDLFPVDNSLWQFYRTFKPRGWKIFIARQHTDARYWYSKSVRLSVRHVPVLYENGLTHCHNFFSIR